VRTASAQISCDFSSLFITSRQIPISAYKASKFAEILTFSTAIFSREGLKEKCVLALKPSGIDEVSALRLLDNSENF
jgi:hypothetical protein